jgi:signal peptidase II
MSKTRQVSVRSFLVAFVVFSCILADQLSKQWAVSHLTQGEPQPFWPGVLQFSIINNPGAAFSLGSTNGQLMGVVATIFTLAIFGWIIKRTISPAPLPAVEQIGMGCILGGAIGNLIDRFNHGQVTDFLQFTFINFPVFNVADALIDVGIAFLFIAIWVCPNDDETTGEATVSGENAVSPASHKVD